MTGIELFRGIETGKKKNIGGLCEPPNFGLFRFRGIETGKKRTSADYVNHQISDCLEGKHRQIMLTIFYVTKECYFAPGGARTRDLRLIRPTL